ncbi:ABC transporter substrate-binding protein [Paenibacillus agricola]|uniref:Extracellular solute-binding protein n=1 Tax=Paenibacillus agricola TaxID=2716264 RepID=A0ABX0J8A2_9BACL|nr:extracellular solute-binding protein [Paenibacillus agricola]NHN32372.1 extracellular solute-binding protein [Paenibacillus agricola]
MKKQTWTGLIGAVTAVSMLAGCSGGATTPAPAAAPSATSPVTIKLHTFGNEANYNWKQTLAAWDAKNTNIKVDLIVLSEKGDSQEASKKLDLAAASGEPMDVLMFSDPAGYAQRVSLGMVEPMDAYIAKDGFKVNEEYKVDTQLNGKYYALPSKFNPWYVLLNKDHLTEAGLEVPKEWTWDQFMEYSKKLTKGEGATKRYGTYFHGPQAGGWLEYLKLAMANQPENTEYVKDDGTSNIDTPNFRKTLEIRAKMEKVDKSATPYADMLSQKLHYRNQFFNQSVSMILIGSWMNTELGGTEQFPLNFNVAVAPYPKNAAGDEGGFTPVTTDYVSIAASSKNKEAAYQFIRWYTTDGQIAQAKNVPAWNKVKAEDLSKIIDTTLAATKSPEKVDKVSLNTVLSQAKSSRIIPPVSYQAEIFKAVNEEYEQFIFDKQDLDTTVKKTKERVDKIIAANKK